MPSQEPAASAPAHAAKHTAIMLRSAALRDRPTTNATGDAVVQAETRVRLEASVKNGDGDWWFVTAAGVGGGWVLESEMGSPQE